MDVKIAQQLLKEAGAYRAELDGLIGPATRAAVERIETAASDRHDVWPWPRRIIAAAQRCLALRGLYYGEIDGMAGPKTEVALTRWRAAPIRDDVTKAPVRGVPLWPQRRDRAAMDRLFGAPGGAQATAGRCVLPFPFVIAWDVSQRINSFPCNSRCAEALQQVFNEAAAHYGEAEFRRLRLDHFGGCYNDRMMRGSTTSVSTHAWGVAIDIDPENNQLKWGRDRASLARPEYDAFWRIIESKGGYSLGRRQNRDWMHFQFCAE